MQSPVLRRHIHRLRLDYFSLVKDTVVGQKGQRNQEKRKSDTEHLSKDQGDANTDALQFNKTL